MDLVNGSEHHAECMEATYRLLTVEEFLDSGLTAAMSVIERVHGTRARG